MLKNHRYLGKELQVKNMSNEINCPHCGEKFDITEEMERNIKVDMKNELSAKLRKQFEEEYNLRLKNEQEEEIRQRKAMEGKITRQREELENLRELKIELDDLKSETEIKIKEAESKAVREAKILFNQEFEEKVSARIKEATSEDEIKITKLELQLERQNTKIQELEEQRTSSHGELEGEALEIAAEDTLSDLFPFDSIKPVKKGNFGADIEHIIISKTGSMSGKILWEFKKHKNWNDGWISKIRENASAASADISIIVSTTMPEGKDSFTQIEEVWVCRYHELPIIATLLRHTLLTVTRERKRDMNMMTIQERVADYISGQKFASVMKMIISAFRNVGENIRKEEEYMKTNRKKNRALLHQVVDAVTSMAAEIHHLGGGDFEVIKALENDGSKEDNLLTSGDYISDE